MLLVSDCSEGVSQTGVIVAGVIDGPRRSPVGELVGRDEVAAGHGGGVDAEARGGDGHRAFEREVQLGTTESPVEAGRAPIRQHDAVAHRDVADAVGAAERAVHAVQRGRLGSAQVGTDVLDGLVAEADQLAVAGETRRDLGDPLGGRRAGGEVLQAVLDPANRDTEVAGHCPHEDDGGVDRRLDTEAPTRVGWGDEPELGSGETEGSSRNHVQRERALEVRPRGEGLVRR